MVERLKWRHSNEISVVLLDSILSVIGCFNRGGVSIVLYWNFAGVSGKSVFCEFINLPRIWRCFRLNVADAWNFVRNVFVSIGVWIFGCVNIFCLVLWNLQVDFKWVIVEIKTFDESNFIYTRNKLINNIYSGRKLNDYENILFFPSFTVYNMWHKKIFPK